MKKIKKKLPGLLAEKRGKYIGEHNHSIFTPLDG